MNYCRISFVSAGHLFRFRNDFERDYNRKKMNNYLPRLSFYNLNFRNNYIKLIELALFLEIITFGFRFPKSLTFSAWHTYFGHLTFNGTCHCAKQ